MRSLPPHRSLSHRFTHCSGASGVIPACTASGLPPPRLSFPRCRRWKCSWGSSVGKSHVCAELLRALPTCSCPAPTHTHLPCRLVGQAGLRTGWQLGSGCPHHPRNSLTYLLLSYGSLGDRTAEKLKCFNRLLTAVLQGHKGHCESLSMQLDKREAEGTALQLALQYRSVPGMTPVGLAGRGKRAGFPEVSADQ